MPPFSFNAAALQPGRHGRMWKSDCRRTVIPYLRRRDVNSLPCSLTRSLVNFGTRLLLADAPAAIRSRRERLQLLQFTHISNLIRGVVLRDGVNERQLKKWLEGAG